MMLDTMGAGYIQTGHAVAWSIQTAMLLGDTLWKYRLCAEPLKSKALMDCIAWAHETGHIYGEELMHKQE